jgi:hypothetical protein
MHLLGRSMSLTATPPGKTPQKLVNVPDWDFNWQTTYTLKEPVKLPIWSRIDLEARYDNSANNPLNPSTPPKTVTWGEQTTDEMCIGFVHFTVDAEQFTKRDEKLHRNCNNIGVVAGPQYLAGLTILTAIVDTFDMVVTTSLGLGFCGAHVLRLRLT